MEIAGLQVCFFSQDYICFDQVVEVILYLLIFWYLGYKIFVVLAAVEISKE